MAIYCFLEVTALGRLIILSRNCIFSFSCSVFTYLYYSFSEWGFGIKPLSFSTIDRNGIFNATYYSGIGLLFGY